MTSDNWIIRGLLYRAKDYLYTKQGKPRKRLNHVCMISAEQLKWLVENSNLMSFDEQTKKAEQEFE